MIPLCVQKAAKQHHAGLGTMIEFKSNEINDLEDTRTFAKHGWKLLSIDEKHAAHIVYEFEKSPVPLFRPNEKVTELSQKL